MSAASTKWLRRLGWGLTLVWFDFRIGGFDFSPDVIGYLLAASALSEASSTYRTMRSARTLALLLAAGEIPGLILVQPGLLGNIEQYELIPLYAHIYIQAMQLLHLLLMLLICWGMDGIADKANERDLQGSIRVRRISYSVVGMGMQIFYPFIFNLEASVWVYMLIIGMSSSLFWIFSSSGWRSAFPMLSH
ncbi:hypothetical protein [Paenibacillus herberti]|uniref:Uncharacterized protein n=1 Tax=Paenibacillus herberti TaxID=1619309 RepID=A0A229P1F0_9BACL|nr:hypothetical protein [Paenibacillus herberti]OXM15719.1 hypothetical protein CGZ75_03050 [Paenibacillus herberti]